MSASISAPEARLDTRSSNSSGWGSEPCTKWHLLDWLRQHSALAGQRLCMTDSDGRPVILGRANGAATFARVRVCGKRSCPNCGPRLAIAHRDDIAQVVGRAKRAGYSVRFLTLTLRHRASDPLSATLDALLLCWMQMGKTGTWTRAKKNVGLVGAVRVLECKHGEHNGWHPHLHVLLFIRPFDRELEYAVGKFYVTVLELWKRQTRYAGYEATVEAQDMREVGDEHLDRIAGYMTKELDIAAEMTGGEFKSGHGSFSPLGLLRRAVAGDDRAAELYREYELATKGRRLYAAPTKALRDLLAAAPAPDTEQAVQEPEPIDRERLAVVSAEGYRSIARVPGFRAGLAAAVEDAVDGWCVVRFLDHRGIASRPLDDAPPTAEAKPETAHGGGAADELAQLLDLDLPF